MLRTIIGFAGSIGVALVLTALGLIYDATALLYAGVIILALVIVAWLFFWAHPLPQTVVQEAGPEAARAAEEARERQERRRQIIDDARKMAARFELMREGNWTRTTHRAEFLAVRPHLSQAYMDSLNKGVMRIVAVGGEGRDGNVVDFLKELDRLEREWGLS